MARLTLAGVAALVVLLGSVATSSAELRTGSAPTKYPEPEASSPTRPELKRAEMRYDDTAGTLQFTLTLYDPLADPATTSALRSWRYYLSVGDYVNGICAGGDRTWLGISGALVDPAQAVLDAEYDFVGNRYPDIPAIQTISEDRTQITIAATDPRLVGLGTICADARIFDARESRDAASDTYAFLLDGFDAADGALARELRDHLRFEIGAIALRLRPRIGDTRLSIRCREVLATEFSCRASGRLLHVPGQARISVRGRMRFDPRGALKLGGGNQHGWRADMRAKVAWRHCPADAGKALRGKRCHKKARWRGNELLVNALGI